MSALGNLSWSFPITEMSQYLPEHFALIMPVVVVILGILIALLVVDGITDVLLKVGFFIVGHRSYGGGIGSADFGIEMDIPIGGGRSGRGRRSGELGSTDFGIEMDIPIGGGRSGRGRRSGELGNGQTFDLPAEDYEVDDD